MKASNGAIFPARTPPTPPRGKGEAAGNCARITVGADPAGSRGGIGQALATQRSASQLQMVSGTSRCARLET